MITKKLKVYEVLQWNPNKTQSRLIGYVPTLEAAACFIEDIKFKFTSNGCILDDMFEVIPMEVEIELRDD